MGPSLTAREPRRSSRRPTCTPASRASLSPPSPHHLQPALSSPRTPTTPTRILPPPAFKHSNSFSKRVKQEQDDSISHPTRTPMDDATIPTTNGRAKRKPKDKVEVVLPPPIVPDPPPRDVLTSDIQDENDDDGGITRCVCGRTEVDADEEELGFMVMCETCKVWQHGVCVNLRQEDAADQDYYCEQCRPDLHVDLLKSLKKRARHSVNPSQPNARRHSASVPRSSRSHSPGHVLAAATAVKAPKRRNTMNSRDAAYEDALKQILESTRPDADKDVDGHTDKDKDEHTQHEEPNVIIEIVSGARKKRKRTTVEKENTGAENVDRSAPPKRNRSNSSTPDRPIASTLVHRDGPVNGATTNGNGAGPRHASASSGAGAKQNAVAGPSKYKRGRKEATGSADTTDAATSSKKHPNQYTYRKPVAPTPPRRPGPHIANGTGGTSVHDHGTRRNVHAPHLHAPAPPQPLLTSWGLPDYLAHLAPVLPTDVPQPVEVRVLDSGADGSGDAPTGAPGEEKVLERGVKVKWPAKRTSVGDMNKRVRGIIDWVGREQAVAVERRRRRDALRQAFKEQTRGENGDADEEEPPDDSATTPQMEELMKELIAFQEKYGHR